MFDLSILQIVTIYSTLFAAALMQGVVGFGFALVVAPILGLIDMRFVPAPLVMSGFIITGIMFLQEKEFVVKINVGLATFGLVFGSILGAIALVSLSENGLTIGLGIALLIAVFANLFGGSIRFNRKNLLIGGFFTGLMGTITSIGGPPIALVFQSQKPEVIRGNLAAFFSLGIIITLTTLFFAGRFSWQEATTGAQLMPPIFMGVMLSGFFKKKVNHNWVRYGILTLCTLASTTLITKGIIT